MFAIRNLSTLAYAQGFTLWHYKGLNCTREQMLAPGFFDDAAKEPARLPASWGYTLLSINDWIMCSGSDGGCLVIVATDTAPVLVARMMGT